MAEAKRRKTSTKVSIIGSGLIGRCWAVLFSRGGHSVCVYDIDLKQLQTAQTSIRQQLKKLQEEGLLRTSQTAEELAHAMTFTSDFKEAVKNALHIQECVPEDLGLKSKVFADLDALIGHDTVLASSTSCIMPSLFTKDLGHRKQCIVAHPVNPPHYVPLVEVIPAPWTETAVVERTVSLMKDLGQAPVVAKKEVNGFIFNRLQYALIMEAWKLVEDGVASPEDVDTAISQGLGLRYSFVGVFETMHLNAQGIGDYCQLYGDNILTVCKTQVTPCPLSGDTLETVRKAMEKRVPLEELEQRRAWRDRRLAALAIHKMNTSSDEFST